MQSKIIPAYRAVMGGWQGPLRDRFDEALADLQGRQGDGATTGTVEAVPAPRQPIGWRAVGVIGFTSGGGYYEGSLRETPEEAEEDTKGNAWEAFLVVFPVYEC